MSARRASGTSLAAFKDEFPSEEHALMHVARIRFGEDLNCPRCQSIDRDCLILHGRLLICRQCRARTSIVEGTLFSNTKIPVLSWFYLLLIMNNEVRTLPVSFVSRHLGISRQAAFRMLGCIRIHLEALLEGRVLGGASRIVQVDETWIPAVKATRGIGSSGVMVFGIHSSEGVYTKVIDHRTREQLFSLILTYVHPDTIIVTDQLRAYRGLSKFGFRHITLNHSRGEYANAEGFSSIGIEGYWGNLKYALASNNITPEREHFPRYLAEHAFQFSCRMRGLEPFREMIARFPVIDLRKLPPSVKKFKQE